MRCPATGSRRRVLTTTSGSTPSSRSERPSEARAAVGRRSRRNKPPQPRPSAGWSRRWVSTTTPRTEPEMAELPELEILRTNLDKDLNGRKVKSVEVAVPAVVKRNTNKSKFAARLDGAKFGGTTRKGTYLLTAIDTGEVLVTSLGDRGLLLRTQ